MFISNFFICRCTLVNKDTLCTLRVIEEFKKPIRKIKNRAV